MKTSYINLKDINDLQERIMLFVDLWVHTEKTPVPLNMIIARMKADGEKPFTTVNAINTLLKKGYIRRAFVVSNKTFFVQLRRV